MFLSVLLFPLLSTFPLLVTSSSKHDTSNRHHQRALARDDNSGPQRMGAVRDVMYPLEEVVGNDLMDWTEPEEIEMMERDSARQGQKGPEQLDGGISVSAGVSIIIGTSSSSVSSTPSPTSTSAAATTSSSSSSTSAATTTTSSSTSATTTTTSSGTCDPSYTPTARVQTISGTGTLPKPSSFVVRDGPNGLSLDGRPYRPVGPNIYWLGLDENVIPNPSYPSKQRIREAMAMSVAMGANTIRSHTLGISTNNPLSVEPTLDEFNPQAFDSIDYAIYAAHEYGLRLIIPLTDQYKYYHGGKYNFLNWTGQTQDDYGNSFYDTREPAFAAYKRYIQHLITHVNKYTGRAYNTDPTIFAWENGNEFGAYMDRQGYPPEEFTQESLLWIKELAPLQLTIDGTDGLWNSTTKVAAPGLNASAVDISSDHLYPPDSSLLQTDWELVQNYSKAFIIGEYDWTEKNGGTDLNTFYKMLEGNAYTGDLIWSLFGHDDQCCQFVRHNDPFSLYYPNGNPPEEQASILKVVQHWYRVTGRPVPQALPAVACPQPEF